MIKYFILKGNKQYVQKWSETDVEFTNDISKAEVYVELFQHREKRSELIKWACENNYHVKYVDGSGFDWMGS